MPALQVVPGATTSVALLGTFLVGWAVMAFTAQIAASFFLPEAPWLSAVAVALPLAMVSLALAGVSLLATATVAVVVDAAAFRLVYGVENRTTALLVVLHLAATVAVVALLANLATLLAPA